MRFNPTFKEQTSRRTDLFACCEWIRINHNYVIWLEFILCKIFLNLFSYP